MRQRGVYKTRYPMSDNSGRFVEKGGCYYTHSNQGLTLRMRQIGLRKDTPDLKSDISVRLDDFPTLFEAITQEAPKDFEPPKDPVVSQSFTRRQHMDEMLQSLSDALRQAGGDPLSIIKPDLTLEQMVGSLAQNGIRFCCDKKGIIK